MATTKPALETISVAAPAKINLTLEVLSREPNGYHTIDTLFCWLDLEDTLEMTATRSTSFQVAAVGVGLEQVPVDQSNLVWRALRALETKAGRELPTHFSLIKRIPAGGGLGGGSADAAAALWGLNELHRLNLTLTELLQLAAPLGADVSFGLVGGLARGRVYGQELEELSADAIQDLGPLVLIFPPLACSTPEVYQHWDSLRSESANGATNRFLIATSASQRLAAIANDLEEPALSLFPELLVYRDKMIELGLEGVCLSGSGSTFFAFLPSWLDFVEVERELGKLGAKALSTSLRESRRRDSLPRIR